MVVAESDGLQARLGGKHLRFTDAERCRLARQAHALGRKLLSELDTLVTPPSPSSFCRCWAGRVSQASILRQPRRR